MEPIQIKNYKNKSGQVFCTLVYHDDERMIEDVWHGGFGGQDSFRRVMLDIVEIIAERKIKRWLADLRGLESSFNISHSWIMEELVPRTMKAGLEVEAIVMPQNLLAQLSASDAVNRTNRMDIRPFSNYDAAKQWLLQTEISSY